MSVGILGNGTNVGHTTVTATQAKYEALTTIGIKVRLRGDSFGSALGTHRLFEIPGKSLRLDLYRDTAGGDWYAAVIDNNGTRFLSLADGFSPSNSAYYVIRISVGPDNCRARMYDSAGTPFKAQSTGSAGPSYATGSGAGTLRIGDANTGTTRWYMDGLAVYSTHLSDTGITNTPASGDANIVGGYLFSEGSGTSVADLVAGGTALTLTGSTSWTTGGSWDALAGSITLDVTPEDGPTVVQRTQSTQFTATVSRAGGFAGTVNVAVTGLPSGVTASPAPLAIANPNTSGTITLSATGAATLGAATVTFTASGSGVSDVTDSVDISVTEAPAGAARSRVQLIRPPRPTRRRGRALLFSGVGGGPPPVLVSQRITVRDVPSPITVRDAVSPITVRDA